jgi:hypothetical protein
MPIFDDLPRTGRAICARAPGASGRLLPGAVPEKFTTLPLDLQRIPGIPQTEIVLYAEAAAFHDANIQLMMKSFPNAFAITRSIEVDGHKVHVGGFMKLKDFEAAPLYVEETGRVRLVFA